MSQAPDASRVRVDGKCFALDDRRFRFRGVTYGTFRPRPDGARFPGPRQVERDLAAISAGGFTVVRTYTAPPEDLIQLAADHGLRIFTDVFYRPSGPTTSRVDLLLPVRAHRHLQPLVPGWLLAPREDAKLAEQLLGGSCYGQNIAHGQLSIHADRGSSMASKPVALLLADLGPCRRVTKSHSRPRVSNDNPFSESQFKTLKYRPDFPTGSTRSSTPGHSAAASSVGTTISTVCTRTSG